MVSVEKAEENLCGENINENTEISVKTSITQIVENSNKVTVKKFICVWGTRINEFEFSGKKWGAW